MLRASLTNACMFRFACIVRLTARLTITQNATGWFCLRSELPQLLDPFSDLYCLRSERRLSYEYEHRPEMISTFRFVKEAGQPESNVRPPPTHGTKSVLINVHNICTLASLPYSMLAQPFQYAWVWNLRLGLGAMCFRSGLDVDRIWFSSAAPKQSPQLGLLRTLTHPIPGYGRRQTRVQNPPKPGYKTSVPWFCPPKPGYENRCTLVLPSQTRVRKPLYPGFAFPNQGTETFVPWFLFCFTLDSGAYPGFSTILPWFGSPNPGYEPLTDKA